MRPWPIDFSSLHRLDALARAHAGERLVEQQQARRGRERQADLEPPLLAVGELPRPACRRARSRSTSASVCSTCSSRPGTLPRLREQVEAELAAQLGQRGDREVLAHGQAREQLVDLVALGQAELADVGDAHAGDVAALEHDRAGRSAAPRRSAS